MSFKKIQTIQKYRKKANVLLFPTIPHYYSLEIISVNCLVTTFQVLKIHKNTEFFSVIILYM